MMAYAAHTWEMSGFRKVRGSKRAGR